MNQDNQKGVIAFSITVIIVTIVALSSYFIGNYTIHGLETEKYTLVETLVGFMFFLGGCAVFALCVGLFKSIKNAL